MNMSGNEKLVYDLYRWTESDGEIVIKDLPYAISLDDSLPVGGAGLVAHRRHTFDAVTDRDVPAGRWSCTANTYDASEHGPSHWHDTAHGAIRAFKRLELYLPRLEPNRKGTYVLAISDELMANMELYPKAGGKCFSFFVKLPEGFFFDDAYADGSHWVDDMGESLDYGIEQGHDLIEVNWSRRDDDGT